MEIKDRISQWVDSHRAELLRDIGRLVAVKSVRGEPAEGAPFGPGPRAALDEALALCGEYGFETKMYGGAVGVAEFSSLPSALDILGHLDVVGEGEGWDTDPYTATEKDDGCLYGRGTDDDKGPVVIALYAMRCLKELGVELSHGCRLIMGTDEESGSGDLPYFYKDNAPAPNTVTPDTGFPVYNTEKGRWAPDLSAGWAKSDALPRVAALNGGFRVNVIPGDATALVLGLDADTALWAAHEAAGKLARQLGSPEPLLVTTVKPEGTLSLLPTVSSGIHYSHAPYYIRRVRITATDPLCRVCEDLGYPVFPEVGQDPETCRTKVVEFPVRAPEGRVKSDVSAIEQLENYKMFMTHYVDHNCSITVHVRDAEWDAVEQWVWDNWDDVVALSFLSYDDNFYELLPYEAITEEEYNRRKAAMKPFNPSLISRYEHEESELDIGESECAGGVCPVR